MIFYYSLDFYHYEFNFYLLYYLKYLYCRNHTNQHSSLNFI